MWLKSEYDNLLYPVSVTDLPRLGDVFPCLFYLLGTFSLFSQILPLFSYSCTDSVAFRLISVDFCVMLQLFAITLENNFVR